jgi:hypothetical protein
VTPPEQVIVGLERSVRAPFAPHESVHAPHEDAQDPALERAARQTLRAQVAKLELELANIVARGFPFIRPNAPGRREESFGGPRLLTLAELERSRDRLAMRVREASEQSSRRFELEGRARELLAEMKLEPGRYKFVRLPAVDVGEKGCGVWQVRPRLGLIGMFAGWWHVKLSSGCPLPRGPRLARGPTASTAESWHPVLAPR